MYRGFLLGATVALGAVMLLPGVAPAMARAGRPIARAAMRTGAVAYDEFRAAAAETFEQVEDIVAEVREEMRERRRSEMAEAAAETADAGGDGD